MSKHFVGSILFNSFVFMKETLFLILRVVIALVLVVGVFVETGWITALSFLVVFLCLEWVYKQLTVLYNILMDIIYNGIKIKDGED